MTDRDGTCCPGLGAHQVSLAADVPIITACEDVKESERSPTTVQHPLCGLHSRFATLVHVWIEHFWHLGTNSIISSIEYVGKFASMSSTKNALRRRPYRVECTGSLPTSEVKRRRARLVLGWGTAREVLRVLTAFSSPCFYFGSALQDMCA